MLVFIRKTISAICVIAILCSIGIIAFAEGDSEQLHEKINQDELTDWIENYLEENHLLTHGEIISVGFCDLYNSDSWYYNGDEWMYPASLYKVPVAMLVTEQYAGGVISIDDTYNGVRICDLVYNALVYSDNDSALQLVEYLGGTRESKCAEQTKKFTMLSDDYFDEQFYTKSYYTARYMTEVFETLYCVGDCHPSVIYDLCQAVPEGFNSLMGADYIKAMKYGSYDRNQTCSGIVFTPNPIIITIFTKNVANFKTVMKEIGDHLIEYSLTLHKHPAKLSNWLINEIHPETTMNKIASTAADYLGIEQKQIDPLEKIIKPSDRYCVLTYDENGKQVFVKKADWIANQQ